MCSFLLRIKISVAFSDKLFVHFSSQVGKTTLDLNWKVSGADQKRRIDGFVGSSELKNKNESYHIKASITELSR